MSHEHHHEDERPLTVQGLFYAIDYFFERLEEVQALHTINRKLDIIMGIADELKQQVADQAQQIADMQTSLDTEQDQIRSAIDSLGTTNTSLQATIDQLNAVIAAGATPEQLQEIKDALAANSTALAAVKTDLEGTIPDAPPAPPEG